VTLAAGVDAMLVEQPTSDVDKDTVSPIIEFPDEDGLPIDNPHGHHVHISMTEDMFSHLHRLHGSAAPASHGNS
jgi:hypothetical protein